VRLVTVISLMLAVPDAAAASAWYRRALGATELWNLGSVIGLEVQGAPFFLAQPEGNRWESPVVLGTTTVRVEVFVDDPDKFVGGAAAAGANYHDPVRNHEMPWGRIGKADSSIRTAISGWWATSRRYVAIPEVLRGHRPSGCGGAL
jgi:catechol 2,3-dioxygenase-like lactoylglutathione lyase family enzyme